MSIYTYTTTQQVAGTVIPVRKEKAHVDCAGDAYLWQGRNSILCSAGHIACARKLLADILSSPLSLSSQHAALSTTRSYKQANSENMALGQCHVLVDRGLACLAHAILSMRVLETSCMSRVAGNPAVPVGRSGAEGDGCSVCCCESNIPSWLPR